MRDYWHVAAADPGARQEGRYTERGPDRQPLDISRAYRAALDSTEGTEIMAGNLYRRGKTWWARFTVDGTETRQSLRTVHVAEARKRLAKLKTDAEDNSFWGGTKMAWEAAMLRYTSEVMPAAVKPSTAKRYNVSLRQVSPLLHGSQ